MSGINLKAEYVTTNHRSFGRDTRVVLQEHNIDCGAARAVSGHHAGKYEAFATFGKEGLNAPGFETEEAALEHAEKWLMGKLEDATKALRNAIVRRS